MTENRFTDEDFERLRDTEPIAGLVQTLLERGWGRGITSVDDTVPCPNRAEQILVLYTPDGDELEVRLCGDHLSIVLANSSPHDEGNDDE